MKGKLGFLALFGITFFSLTVAFTATIAWFSSRGFDFTNDRINGQTQGAYFAYGNGKPRKEGTDDCPFGIANTRHLNNLAWLQYSGYFNNKDLDGNTSNGSERFYFELANDINYNGSTYKIPPIGTETNPFTGVFDGNGHTINNIKVTNDSTIDEHGKYIAFSNKPNAISFALTNNDAPDYAKDKAEVVGLFGYVGDKENDIYSTDDCGISNVTLNNIEVESKTSATLIGLAAGYIDADMSNVNINGSATISVNGQTAKTGYETKNLSDYGLVGYTTQPGSKGNFTQDLSEYYTNGSGVTPGAGWGGSINSKKNMQWLYYMRNNYSGGVIRKSTSSDVKPNEYPTNDLSDYRIKFTTTSDNSTNPENVTSGSAVYQLRADSYLPLSWANDTDTQDSYTSWSSTSSYNTGYIAGVDSTGLQGSPKFASYPIRNIAHSLSNCGFSPRQIYNNVTTGSGMTGTIPTSFNEGTFNVLTYSPTAINKSNWVWIYDNNSTKGKTRNTDTYQGRSGVTGYSSYPKGNGSGNNPDTTPSGLGLVKYQYESATKPGSLYRLKQNLTNAKDSFGIIFDFISPSNSNYKTLTCPVKVMKSGQTIEYNTNSSNRMNYRIPKGAIDFSLNEDGYVNFFAATMYSCLVNGEANVFKEEGFFKFFSLYHVDRTIEGSTSNYNLKEIYKIYKNRDFNPNIDPSSDSNPQYVYSYDSQDNNLSSPGTKGDLVFDVYGVLNSSAPVKNAVYYFEFPLNDGEYSMGRASSTTSKQGGSYLLYLDIAASGQRGNKDNVKVHHITTKQNDNFFPTGVDFIPIDVAGNGGESISVSIDSGSSGIATFLVTKNDISVTDESEISSYAYRSSKYKEENPSSDEFTCNLPGAPPSYSTGGERVLLIDLVTSSSSFTFRITDTLENTDGVITISNTTYEVKDGNVFNTCTLEYITGKSNVIKIADFRALTIAATLTRTSTSGKFTTTYDTNNCNYQNKIVDVDIELTGNATTLSIAVTNGYTFKIGGTTYNNGSTYPSQQ